jgi:hypothetical protein
MSWVDPLKRLIRVPQERHVPPKPEPREEPAPSFGILAQSSRILKLAHVYRREIRRAAEAREREREGRERAERERRQLAWEDEVARSLAARWSHFPGDGAEARTPEVTPLIRW